MTRHLILILSFALAGLLLQNVAYAQPRGGGVKEIFGMRFGAPQAEVRQHIRSLPGLVPQDTAQFIDIYRGPSFGGGNAEWTLLFMGQTEEAPPRTPRLSSVLMVNRNADTGTPQRAIDQLNRMYGNPAFSAAGEIKEPSWTGVLESETLVRWDTAAGLKVTLKVQRGGTVSVTWEDPSF